MSSPAEGPDDRRPDDLESPAEAAHAAEDVGRATTSSPHDPAVVSTVTTGLLAALLVGLSTWWLTTAEGARRFAGLDDLWQDLVGPAPDEVSGLLGAMDTLGSWPWAGVLTAVAALGLVVARQLRAAVGVVLAVAVNGVLLTPLLKELTGRDRPLDGTLTLDSMAFPSGHTSFVAALTVALALVLTRGRASEWRPLAMLVALVAVALMAWSRTALGVHWLTDTAGGALLGLASGLLVPALVDLVWDAVGRRRRTPGRAQER